MRQVLFHLPIYFFPALPDGIPIYGYGMMLFVAFVACTFLASWRAQKEGIAKEHLQDLAIWIFVFGIVGARLTFMIQYHQQFDSPWQFFRIWDGGLVFYGSAIGGLIGYVLAYFFVLRKYRISTWKVADIVAPCAALGLCLGRFGCFLNGCCYGNVACPDCPKVHFPLSSPARYDLVRKGLQTPAGFTIAGPGVPVVVERVEPGSPAYASGLRDGDIIVKADGRDMTRGNGPGPLTVYLLEDWPKGKTDLTLTVKHKNEAEAKELPAFAPQTLGLHPTQLYESISMALLFLVLMAYYPFKRHDGAVMVLFMLGYAVHRFLNEILRKDTDPVAFGMTLSQNGSILVFLGALCMAWWLWRKPGLPRPETSTAATPAAGRLKPAHTTTSS
jgi:prolipoprotein diacylglyceryltransferase